MKDTVIKVILVIVCIILCFLLFRSCNSKPISDPKVEDIIKVYEDSIISLKDSIQALNSKTERLRYERDTIEKIKYITIEQKIKKLPIDSSILLCRSNLVKYGELTKISDSLPVKLYDGVLLSHNNIKDVNIISEKLETEIKKNKIDEEIILLDSCKLLLYESELACKDSIRDLETVQYEFNLEKIQEDLRKQKREAKKAKVLGWVGTFSGLVVGGATGYFVGKKGK